MVTSTSAPARTVACHGKGRKDRITPLTTVTVTVLRDWMAEHPGPATGPLFPTYRGTPMIGSDQHWRTTFVDSLTASYSAREACREIATLRQGRGSRLDEAEWRSIAEAAHDTTMSCATRFRVLASDETAEVALALHEHNDQDMELLDLDDNGATYLASRKERSALFNEDRDRFVTEARHVLGKAAAVTGCRAAVSP